MNLTIDSMALDLPAVERHPNRLAFRGVLTLVDAPSDRPPAGARGRRVLLTRAAAERALPSLLGMGLGFTPSLDGHDARRKVGVITSAEIVPGSEDRVPSGDSSAPGRLAWARPSPAGQPSAARPASQLGTQHSQLAVTGYIFARDFPEVVRELRLAGRAALGMSYEIADACVADVRAAVWQLDEVTFTGAAVLRRDKAAYSATWIELTN